MRWRAPVARLLAHGLLALGVLLATPAQAQFKPGLQIFIENPPPESSDCGIGGLPLQAVATLTLENNGVRVVPEANLMLYIHPTVLQASRTCFVNLDVSIRIRQPMEAIAGFKPKEGWGAVMLCNAGVAGVADQDELIKDFMNQLVQQIRVCLSTLDY
jgi:hypothetical protein